MKIDRSIPRLKLLWSTWTNHSSAPNAKESSVFLWLCHFFNDSQSQRIVSFFQWFTISSGSTYGLWLANYDWIRMNYFSCPAVRTALCTVRASNEPQLTEWRQNQKTSARWVVWFFFFNFFLTKKNLDLRNGRKTWRLKPKITSLCSGVSTLGKSRNVTNNYRSKSFPLFLGN